MSKKIDLEKVKKNPKEHLKTRADFMKIAMAQQAEILEGGNHTKIRTPKGATVIARHGDSQEFPEGTRCALIRQFKLLGLLSLVVGVITFVSHLI